MPTDAPRAQLIHIETDRRLGHEWDEWDGKPLPGNGDFSAPPGQFFRFASLALGLALGAAAAAGYLLAPRLGSLWVRLPAAVWVALAAGAAAGCLSFGLLVLSFYGRGLLLREGLPDPGPAPH